MLTNCEKKQAGPKHLWLKMLRLPLGEHTVIQEIAFGEKRWAASENLGGRGIFH